MIDQDDMDDAGNLDDVNPAFEPVRRKVDIHVGSFVQSEGRTYRISEVLSFDSIVGVDVETGRSRPLSIHALQPTDIEQSQPTMDLSEIGDADWQIAEKRFAAIAPLVNKGMMTRSDVSQRAAETGVDTSTLYRWLERYSALGSTMALIPFKRGWKKGNNRIDFHVDALVQKVITDVYLSHQRTTAQKTILEIQRRCHLASLEAPSPTTIRARINQISDRDRLRGRGYKERAKNKFTPAAGHFPNADFPLSVIQIDHTPVDLILVDDVYRKPIGRPWVTLAMDVNTRMVTGYYLSFDPPSGTSVAMCVAHSMLPKDEWLMLHHVNDADWPVWGQPRTIHVDNGADFRADNFKRSCLAYGINLEFRPVKQPKYGGHIERILGTFLREIHDLPGTTFSSVAHKENYDSEKNAVMTMTEFEEWLVTLIAKIYHLRKHSSLGMTPLKKWEIGIFGNAETVGVGVPAILSDRMTVLLDFLPTFYRTVQTFGVTIDGLGYYAEVLRPWINASDPEQSSKKRRFAFRRDPRDVSAVWFFDPDLSCYFKIPFADQSLPAMSIWEYRQAQELLKKQGIESVNEAKLLEAVTELRSIVDESKEKSKKARRQAQRRVEHEKKVSPANPQAPTPQESKPILPSGLIDGDIEFFGDIA